MRRERNDKEIKFGLATSEDALEMVDFHNGYYRTKRKPEHWLWEYYGHLPHKSVAVFAKDGDRLIATQGMIPTYMEVGSGRFLTGKSESTLLLPSYRGSDIMPNLYEYAVENSVGRGTLKIWGFTDATKAFEKFRFTWYPDILMMVRPGNLSAGIVSRLTAKAPIWRKAGSTGMFLVFTLLKGRRRISPIQELAGYELKKGRISQEHLHSFYERLKKKYKDIICISYSEEYLDWRIRQHPFIEYSEYGVYQGDELRAYAFVAWFERVASISDLTSEESGATSMLLRAILRDYGKQAGLFRFIGNPKAPLSQDLFNQLSQLGFSTAGNWILVLRDLTGGKIKQIFDIRNWHINGLWTEGYSM